MRVIGCEDGEGPGRDPARGQAAHPARTECIRGYALVPWRQWWRTRWQILSGVCGVYEYAVGSMYMLAHTICDICECNYCI